MNNHVPFADPQDVAEMMHDEFDEYEEAGRRHEEENDHRVQLHSDEEDENETKGIRYRDLQDREIQALTGFNEAEFNELVAALGDGLSPASIGKKDRRPVLLMQPEDRLLLVLSWLRHADKFRKLAGLFGISKSYCYTAVMEIIRRISPLAMQHIVVRRSHQEQVKKRKIESHIPTCHFDHRHQDASLYSPSWLLPRCQEVLLP